MSWLDTQLKKIEADLKTLLGWRNNNAEVLAAIAKAQVSLDLLIDNLIPAPAAKLVLTFTQGAMAMAKKTGTLKFVVQDDGTATGTLQVFDSKGLPTSLKPGIVPTYASNSAAVTATGSADGLSVTVAPVDPPQLADGIIITATAAGAAPDGSDLTADNSDDPGSVVAGAAGKLVLKF